MLNREQEKAVQITDGPIRIIAGPGTGKTLTLISRVRRLIEEKNVKPEKILFLSTSNKASRRLNQNLLKAGLPAIHALTFPGLASGILRLYSDLNFKIITLKECEDMMDMILNADEKNEKQDIQKIREGIIHKSKRLINKTSLSEERIREVIREFDKILAERGGLDQANLQKELIAFWNEKPTAEIACQNLYQYIVVDNYHNLSPLQTEIMTRMAKTHKNLCVAGDPDQTICSLQGARTDAMSGFERQYSDTKSVALTKNYRNPGPILKGAESLISKNIGRLKKPITATTQSEEKISLYKINGYEDQLHLISAIIESQQKNHKLHEIAVFSGGHSEIKQIHHFLSKRGFPCQSSSADSFWGRPEIIDFLDGIESLAHWTNISNEQKFSHWIADKIQKFIKAHQFSQTSVSNLNQMVNCAKMHDHLPTTKALNGFLDECRTYHEADHLIFDDKINVTDFYSAEGLEFPIVVITSLNEDSLPHQALKNEPYWLAEERRMLYAGMTRAQESLHLICTQTPSRFLGEIGEENIDISKETRITLSEQKEAEPKAQLELF